MGSDKPLLRRSESLRKSVTIACDSKMKDDWNRMEAEVCMSGLFAGLR